jgi:hypothetical protein
MGLSFTITAGLRQRSHSQVRVSRDSLRPETPPTWRARSSYVYPPRNRVARLYPQALGALSIASYDSQGYGGGIRPHVHTGLTAAGVDMKTPRCLIVRKRRFGGICCRSLHDRSKEVSK